MNTNEREQLQDQLVEQILDNMDTRTLEQFARERLHDYYQKFTYEELLVDADDYGLDVQDQIPPETDD